MRILIVEDEVAAGNVLMKGLRESGYAVDLAADGEEAVYKSLVNEYDCILLDLTLPLLDGLQVCRQLRKADSKAAILMLTARDGWEDKVKGLDSGADDYITKPFRYQELLARIRAVRRRGPIRHFTILSVADLRLNLHARTVTRGNERIHLTRKEYALLEFLVLRTGDVVSRAEISEHVWDESYDPFSNLIDVYMQRLRAKIDAQHSLKLLHTRRGQGYVLVEEPD